MKMKFVSVGLLLTVLVFTNAEKVSPKEACEEASTLLEMVMFFPVTACTYWDTDQTAGQDNGWIQSARAYGNDVVYLLGSIKTTVLSLGDRARIKEYTDIFVRIVREIATQLASFMTAFSEKIQNELARDVMKLRQNIKKLAERIAERVSILVELSDVAIHEVLPYLSKMSTHWKSMVTLTLRLGDITMTIKARLITFWNECLTTLFTFTSSPCLYVRYAIAGILLASLPFTIYRLVNESIVPMKNKRKLKEPPFKGRGIVYKGIDHGKVGSWSNLFTMATVSYFSGHKRPTVDGYDNGRATILKGLHYGMCELYDDQGCNCGGKTKPIRDERGNHVTRFKLKPAHYPMCEFYDLMNCNCGGYLRKSPLPMPANSEPKRNISDSAISLGLELVENNKESTIDEHQDGNTSETPAVGLREDKVVLEVSIQDGEQCVEENEIINHELNGTSMFTEVSMIEDLDLEEIGHPKFNSSFIEDSLYASTRSDSAYTARGSGDGPMLVITRRSPRKECGLSFTEDDDLDYLDDSGTEADDSLLDVSDINKSLSFNSGDGIYEFAVLYALQTIYRTAKRFFHNNKPTKRLEEAHTSIGDLSRDTYFVVTKRKSRSNSRRPRNNKNCSAKTDEANTQDVNNVTVESSDEESLTDYDRYSDVSSCHGAMSGQGVPAELASWSISSSNDCSSLLRSPDIRDGIHVPLCGEARNNNAEIDIENRIVTRDSERDAVNFSSNNYGVGLSREVKITDRETAMKEKSKNDSCCFDELEHEVLTYDSEKSNLVEVDFGCDEDDIYYDELQDISQNHKRAEELSNHDADSDEPCISQQKCDAEFESSTDNKPDKSQ